jgi:carbon monoxide dehydrogenase subunit G
MRIENTVEVDAPLERVWALVNDIPRVAPCMPGAALTGVGDDNTYEGTVAVKLGPLRMSYKGKVSIDEVDDANHTARLTASGKDTKGAGTARATVETRLEPAGETHTRLHVTSDVQLTGKVASFGRGGAINDVATRLFGQFADCLRATLESEAPTGSGAAGAMASAGAGAPGPAVAEPSPAAPAPGGGPSSTPAAEDTPAAVAEDTSTPVSEEAPAPAASATASSSTSASPTPTSTATTPTGAGATTSAGVAPTPPSGAGAAGDGSATAGAGAPAPAAPTPPRPVEALDAGSLVGTVVMGRLRALFAAVAGFFRRLFGGRRGT